MARFFRRRPHHAKLDLARSVSTSLLFGGVWCAIAAIQEVEGISYGAFIVPGLIMLSVHRRSSISKRVLWDLFPPSLIRTVFFGLLSAPVTLSKFVCGLWVGAAGDQGRLVIGVNHSDHSVFFL